MKSIHTPQFYILYSPERICQTTSGELPALIRSTLSGEFMGTAASPKYATALRKLKGQES
jgi:hypothetical protein